MEEPEESKERRVRGGGSLWGTGLPGSSCGLTSVSVCGAYYKDRRPDAGGLSKGQAAVLLLREDGGLVVDVLHIHYDLWEPGQGQKVMGLSGWPLCPPTLRSTWHILCLRVLVRERTLPYSWLCY